MATYLSNKAQPGVNPKYLQEGTTTVCAVFALTQALALNDLILGPTLPTGASVIDMIISSDAALDTNAASTLAFQVGDSVVAGRYIGGAGGHAQGNNQAMAPYHMDQGGGSQFVAGSAPGTNQIVMKVQAAPATGAAAGNLRLTVIYGSDV